MKHNNMGTVLQDQGELEEAIQAYKQALHIEPKYAEVHRHLSTVTNILLMTYILRRSEIFIEKKIQTKTQNVI